MRQSEKRDREIGGNMTKMDKYEYALFYITDPVKFREFMKTHLSMAPNKDLGYYVQILGCGKEPFEWEGYLDYLEQVKAVDKGHGLYLSLDEWIQMDRPKQESLELTSRIARELS